MGELKTILQEREKSGVTFLTYFGTEKIRETRILKESDVEFVLGSFLTSS